MLDLSNLLPLDSPIQLLVVIVNYRTPHLVIECLQSLKAEVESFPGTHVAVVNNPSGDDSIEKLEAAIASNGWSAWVSLIPAPYNGGFAYGNNVAVRPALQAQQPPNYFLLLNPDTQVRPGALKALVDFLEEHPKAGIAGSSFEEPDGTPWPIAFRFPTLLSEMDAGFRLGFLTKLLSNWVVARTMGNQPDQIDWMPGASMMIRRQVFETAGLMDEDYFLYYEETDFCLQTKRAGWECWYVPKSRVMHISGQSTGVTGQAGQGKRLPQYLFDSRRRYFLKNHGWLYTALADIVWLVGFALWRLRRVVQRKPDGDPPYMLADFARNMVLFNYDLPRNHALPKEDNPGLMSPAEPA